MIRQNFNIDSIEVKRILEMHKNATKNHYLISEQVKQTKQLAPKEFSLPAQTFKSGYHSENSLDPSQKQSIENVLNQMANYIAEKKGSPMSIQIVTGESIPKNFDNENQVSLEKGELARLRGDTIKSILTKFFQGLVDKKILSSMPSIPDPKTNVELGMKQVPYKKGTDNPKDKKYEADQFIKFSVVSSGQETTECLVNLEVKFVYVHQENPKLPCRGGHTCDEAIFDVYLNKTMIGVANLNNQNCKASIGDGEDCDRESKLRVSSQMVNSIVNAKDFNNKIMLWYKPTSGGRSHSSVPEIYIHNGKGQRLFPNTSFPNACVAPQAARGDTSSKILMILDGCGNPISMDQNTSAEEMKKLSDEMARDEQERKNEEQKKKDADQQKYLEYLKTFQTTGVKFAPNYGENIFNETNFVIKDMVQQDDNLLVTVSPIRDRTFGYFQDVGYGTTINVKKGQDVKILIPIVKGKVLDKERVFRRENENLPKVGDFGYFTSRPIYGVKTDIKVPRSVIFQPTFEK